MRYFVTTKEIDGYTIVTDFRNPPIDPVATSRVVDTLIEETTEYIEARQLSDSWSQLERNRRGFLAAARKTVNAKALAEIQNNYIETVSKQKSAQARLAVHSQALRVLRKQLYKNNSICFPTPGYEEILDSEHYTFLHNAFVALVGKQLLTIHGDVMMDHRGEQYWLRDEVLGWASIVVKALGEEIPSGAIRSDSLSPENISEIKTQKEAERISSLPTEVRKAEKEAKLARALSIAAQKRSEYEIYGADNPLELSKKWYQEEVAKLENLYG